VSYFRLSFSRQIRWAALFFSVVFLKSRTLIDTYTPAGRAKRIVGSAPPAGQGFTAWILGRKNSRGEEQKYECLGAPFTRSALLLYSATVASEGAVKTQQPDTSNTVRPHHQRRQGGKKPRSISKRRGRRERSDRRRILWKKSRGTNYPVLLLRRRQRRRPSAARPGRRLLRPRRSLLPQRRRQQPRRAGRRR